MNMTRLKLPATLWYAIGMGLGLFLIFLPAWMDLYRYALSNDLYSHVLIIPVISGWFIWQRRQSLVDAVQAQPDKKAASGACVRRLIVPVLVLTLSGIWVHIDPLQSSELLDMNDHLAWTVSIFVSILILLQVSILGGRVLRVVLFPVLFLYLMAPIPGVMLHGINRALQHFTAFVLAGVLKLTCTPMCWDGLTFHLPGLSMEVAEECSGIRSTLVLLITALVGAILFLRKPWSRVVLVVSILPIAALRNALRITTIALLTIHVDPSCFDGPVHRQGGPPFFVLSLVPLFVIMWLLRRMERSSKNVEEDRKDGCE